MQKEFRKQKGGSKGTSKRSFCQKEIMVGVDIKELLKQEGREQEIENLKEGEINWIEDEFYNSWDKICGHMKKLFGHKKIYNPEEKWKPFFLSHSKDEIRGKPLLIQNTKVRLPLIRQAVKKEDKRDENGKKTGENIEIQSFYMLGEKFDKRHDGFQKDAFALDFYKYQVITPNDKEFYVFSQNKISSENSILKGMAVELDDFSEMSRTMKIPSLSRIFFCKEFEPSIKTLSPEKLIDFVKKKEIDETKWLTHLTIHPYGTLNNFPYESEKLHSSWLLCGKEDGYPNHLIYWGPQGTKKTMGKGETTEFKFSMEKIIVDSGNSSIKGLGASHKGTILNPGYLTKQQRIGIVDEIGKMVEKEVNKSGGVNILGEFNPILEHKERVVASGNTGESGMKPTAKFMQLTNPINNRSTLGSHVGILDPTFLSRNINWVQDAQEQDLVLSKWGLIRLNSAEIDKKLGEIREKIDNSTPKDINKHTWDVINNKLILLKKSFGVSIGLELIDKDTFLTIFDSCYHFNSSINLDEVQRLADMTSNLAKEPMRGVWRPRSFHHIFLIVDGLTKERCLFKDHDSSFTAKQIDYDLAKRILIRMVKGWDTVLTPKQEGFS
jgi:hypothetical protein